jgi:hypothetical protein
LAGARRSDSEANRRDPTICIIVAHPEPWWRAQKEESPRSPIFMMCRNDRQSPRAPPEANRRCDCMAMSMLARSTERTWLPGFVQSANASAADFVLQRHRISRPIFLGRNCTRYL